MQLTKGAIGNLIAKYKSVLKKCHLLNVFGTLAVGGILVMGSAVVADATISVTTANEVISASADADGTLTGGASKFTGGDTDVEITTTNNTLKITNSATATVTLAGTYSGTAFSLQIVPDGTNNLTVSLTSDLTVAGTNGVAIGDGSTDDTTTLSIANKTLTVTNGLTLNGNAAAKAVLSSTNAGTASTVDGDVTVTLGTITATNGLTITGTLDLGAAAAKTVITSSDVTNGAGLHVGTLSLSNSARSIGSGTNEIVALHMTTLTGGNDLTLANGGTLVTTGGITLSQTVADGSQLLATGGDLYVGVDAETLAGYADVTALKAGTFSGTLTLSGFDNDTATLAPSTALNIYAAGINTGADKVLVDGSTNAATITLTPATTGSFLSKSGSDATTLILGEAATLNIVTSGTATASNGIVGFGNKTTTAGILNIADGTVTLGGIQAAVADLATAADVEGTVNIGDNGNTTSSTVTAPVSVIGTSANSATLSITIDQSSTLNATTITVGNSDGTVTAGQSILGIDGGGNGTNKLVATTTNIYNDGEFTIAGATDLTAELGEVVVTADAAGDNQGKLVLGNTGSATVTATSLTSAGDVDVAKGILTLTGNLEVTAGTVVVTNTNAGVLVGGATTISGGTVTIATDTNGIAIDSSSASTTAVANSFIAKGDVTVSGGKLVTNTAHVVEVANGALTQSGEGVIGTNAGTFTVAGTINGTALTLDNSDQTVATVAGIYGKSLTQTGSGVVKIDGLVSVGGTNGEGILTGTALSITGTTTDTAGINAQVLIQGADGKVTVATANSGGTKVSTGGMGTVTLGSGGILKATDIILMQTEDESEDFPSGTVGVAAGSLDLSAGGTVVADSVTINAGGSVSATAFNISTAAKDPLINTIELNPNKHTTDALNAETVTLNAATATLGAEGTPIALTLGTGGVVDVENGTAYLDELTFGTTNGSLVIADSETAIVYANSLTLATAANFVNTGNADNKVSLTGNGSLIIDGALTFTTGTETSTANGNLQVKSIAVSDNADTTLATTTTIIGEGSSKQFLASTGKLTVTGALQLGDGTSAGGTTEGEVVATGGLAVTGGTWSINKLSIGAASTIGAAVENVEYAANVTVGDLSVAGNVLTIGDGSEASTLTVTGTSATSLVSSATNVFVITANSTMTVDAAALGTWDFTATDEGLLTFDKGVSAADAFKIDGTGTLSIKNLSSTLSLTQYNKLKGLLDADYTNASIVDLNGMLDTKEAEIAEDADDPLKGTTNVTEGEGVAGTNTEIDGAAGVRTDAPVNTDGGKAVATTGGFTADELVVANDGGTGTPGSAQVNIDANTTLTGTDTDGTLVSVRDSEGNPVEAVTGDLVDMNVSDNVALTLGESGEANTGTLGDITLGKDSTLTATGAEGAAFTVGDVTGGTGSKVETLNDTALTADSINVGEIAASGDVTSNGAITAPTITADSGNVTAKDGDIKAEDAITATGSAITAEKGAISAGDVALADGSTLSASDSVAATGDVTVSGDNQNKIEAGGALDIDGALTSEGAGGLAATAAGNVDLTSVANNGEGDVAIATTKGDVTATGDLTTAQNAGDLKLTTENGAVSTQALTNAGAGDMEVSTAKGTVDVTGDVQNSGQGNTTISSATDTVTVTGDLTSGAEAGNTTVSGAKAVKVTGSLDNASDSGTMSVKSTENTVDTGAITNEGEAGTVEIEGAKAVTVGGAVANTQDGTVKVASTGDAVTVASLSNEGDAGTVEVSASKAATVTGAMTNAGESTMSVTSTGNAVTVGEAITNANGTMTVSAATEVAAAAGITNEDGTVTVTAGTKATIADALTNDGGTVSVSAGNGPLAINGATGVSNADGTVTLSAAGDKGSVTSAGPLANTGKGTIDVTAAQDISVTGEIAQGDNGVINLSAENGNITATAGIDATKVEAANGTVTPKGDLTADSSLSAQTVDAEGYNVTVGTEDGTATATVGDVKAAKLTLTNATSTVTGDVTLTDGLTVDGGSLTATTQGKKITVGAESTVKEGANVDLTEIDLAGETLYVGTESDTTGGTTLTADKITFNGGSLFLDPAWTLASTNVAFAATETQSGDAYVVNGNIGVGQNSILTIGTDDTTWITSEMAKAGISGLSQNGVTSALGVYSAIQIGSGYGLIVDGSQTSSTLASAVTANNVTFAANSLLVVSASAATSTNGAISAATASTATVAGTAKLYIADAEAGTTYTILGTNITADENTLAAGGWTGDNFLTDNMLTTGSATYDSSTGNIVVTPTAQDASSVYPGLDSDLAPVLTNGVNKGEIGSAYLNSGQGGQRFLSRVLDRNYMGTDKRAVVKTVESAARIAILSGAPIMTFMANEAAANAVTSRTSIANPANSILGMASDGSVSKGGATGDGYKNGFGMWVMPLYQAYNGYGLEGGNMDLDVNGRIGGVALGADYTWDNSFRAGLTFNVGGGYAEGSGDLNSTDNNMNFWGLGAYFGWATPMSESDIFSLTGDINYTQTFNSVEQNVDSRSGFSKLKSDIEAYALSVGVRADYKLILDTVDITPHVGVRYTYLHTNDYKVKGNGMKVLKGDEINQDIWSFPIGVTFSKDFALNDEWYVRPSLDLQVVPHAGDIKARGDVRFTGVSTKAEVDTQVMDYFTYGGQLGVEFGNDTIKLGVNYALQHGANSTSHGVFGTFRVEF